MIFDVKKLKKNRKFHFKINKKLLKIHYSFQFGTFKFKEKLQIKLTIS